MLHFGHFYLFVNWKFKFGVVMLERVQIEVRTQVEQVLGRSNELTRTFSDLAVHNERIFFGCGLTRLAIQVDE